MVRNLIENFFSAINQKNAALALSYLSQNIEYKY